MPSLAELDTQILIEQAELKKQIARESHLAFMQYCWMKDGERDPMVVGFHTRAICERIDKAIVDLKNGKSTYLLISVHHRSGKSDILSRFLGPHFLGEFPDREVMQVTYQANLASQFSAYGRRVFQSKQFHSLYPKIRLSEETNRKNEWLIADKNGTHTGGRLYATGLEGGLTGNGFSLGLLDDYFSGRAEAESKIQRDNAWDAFTNDFMTRVAPVGIVIVLATQWHYDDINGRIRAEMKENPNFPQFEVISFPAKAKDYRGPGTYPGKYLFLERYPESWYLSQYATLHTYGAAALLDCNPQMRTGSLLSTDGIVYDDLKNMPAFTALRWTRIWDVAHTKKQLKGDDPDWTSGTLLAFQERPDDPIMHLWIRHVFRTQEKAVARDKLLKSWAQADGPFVKQAIEDSLDAKDAFDYISSALPEISWSKISIAGGDKFARATPLEVIFGTPGHVHVARGEWNEDWIDEVIHFDGHGEQHDDMIDNMSAGYIFYHTLGIHISNESRNELAQRRAR
jgi:phage terminase large subunit-like protein